jgi:hypothetical protein
MTRIQTPQFRNLAARHFRGSAERRSYSYVVAVLSVAVAIIAAELVTSLLQAEPIASLMLCAVIFTAWFAGFVPALLAITLALLAFHYYLLPPVNSFAWKPDLFVLHVGGAASYPVLYHVFPCCMRDLVAEKATDDFRRSGEALQRRWARISRALAVQCI